MDQRHGISRIVRQSENVIGLYHLLGHQAIKAVTGVLSGLILALEEEVSVLCQSKIKF